MSVFVFNNMIGKTIDRIDGKEGSKEMTFVASDGSIFCFYHYSDCCEYVRIEDICGDLCDLLNSPLVEAHEINSEGPQIQAESYTWTFYRFSSTKGTVTIRWLGTSNGYYSERVSFREKLAIPPVKEEVYQDHSEPPQYYVPKH